MRGPAKCLLLLLQVVAVLGTNAQHYHDSHGDKIAHREADKHALGPKTDAAPKQNQPVIQQAGWTNPSSMDPKQSTDEEIQGADLVKTAFYEFRKIPRSLYRRRRPRRTVIGSILRHIWNSIPIMPAAAPSRKHHKSSINSHLSSAVELLEQAALQNNSDALFVLAELNFFGNYSHPRNLQAAFHHYQRLATDFGNSTAQYMLGLYHSTGIGAVVPRDQAKALLYYTFAAASGDTRAEMATAFRHQGGIGASKSCETAVKYYKRVADKAINWYRSGPPGGMSWAPQGWRMADEDGGVYGEGASVSSSGLNSRKASPHSDANAAIADVIEYLDLVSAKGDSKASFNLGRIYYEGQRGLEKNFDLARRYFFLAASRYWKRDGRVVERNGKEMERTAGKTAGYIGRMYLRGESLPQNMDRARLWFDRGVALGDAQSQYGRGIMFLNGYGGKKNVKLAMEMLTASSNQDFAPAQVQMGRLYLDQGEPDDVRTASNYFELAARYGSMEAHYYLAEMIYHGIGREKLCAMALSYYKNVAESAEPLVSSWADANSAYEAEDLELAFLEYLMAAEQGYEKAQTNVAYMLDTMRSKMSIWDWLGKPRGNKGLLKNPELALVYWTRSSRQSNTDALVKMGDCYFYGVGATADVNKAVQCYTGASDHFKSAQALFNLGWMHENGIGLRQDFHLAKRYYDHALEVNEEAYLPVTLSLLKLRVRSAWNTMTHGPVHSIEDEPKEGKQRSLSEWITNFMGEKKRRLEEEEDGFEVDGLSAAIDGGSEGGEDGGVVESVLIVGITMTLMLLLWWRQRMQQGREQGEEDRIRNPGDAVQQPANGEAGEGGGAGEGGEGGEGFRAWAAGGIGL